MKTGARGGVSRTPRRISIMADTTDTYRSIHSVITDNAARIPDKVYVHGIDQDKSITYGELYRVSNRISHYLDEKGFQANHRVLLLAENSVEFMTVLVGVLRFGATIATANVEMNRAHLAEIVRAVAPRLVVYQDGLDLERLRGEDTPGDWLPLGEWVKDGGTGFFGEVAKLPDDPLPPVNGPKDDASIFYTSGTASKPKGVVMTYRELLANAPAAANMMGLTEDDRFIEFRAMNWGSALILGGISPVYRGATVILARRFSQSRYFDWVREHKVTIGACNPTGLAMFINRPIDIKGSDVPHLRFMMSSSAPLMVAHWKLFEAQYGIKVAQGYGCSEFGWIAGSNETNRRVGTVGKPFAYQKLRIVNADGGELPEGETGEVELGGLPGNNYRYLDDDGSVKVHARDRVRTGDLGFIDQDGYLHLTGRTKELIIRGGVNISPAEIDNILLQMPEIAEAVTIGVPDAIYGEEVVCYIIAKTGRRLTEDQVMAHCRDRLPGFHMPKEIMFRDALPKTERGKVHRKAMVEEWKQAHAAA